MVRDSRGIAGRFGEIVYHFAGVLGVMAGAVGTVCWVVIASGLEFLSWLVLGPLIFALSVGLAPTSAWPRYRHVAFGLATGVYVGYAFFAVLVVVMVYTIGES